MENERIEDVFEIADEIQQSTRFDLTDYEALVIASKIYEIEAYRPCFGLIYKNLDSINDILRQILINQKL